MISSGFNMKVLPQRTGPVTMTFLNKFVMLMYKQISDGISINIWVYTIFLQHIIWAYVLIHVTDIYTTTQYYFF